MPLRNIEFEINNYYHIYNRGFNKNIIFKNDKDFKQFIKTIVRYNIIFTGIKIISFSILPNHFHIILISLDKKSDISEFIGKIQQSYVMYFRSKYKDNYIKIKGEGFFEGNFKVKHINSQKYLEQCISYVVYNSVHHKVVKNITDYKWTSYHQLKNKDKLNNYKNLILDELEI
ncbi:MAG: transposase [Candidatus Gracilibacteria bacterium]|nr:transposase [Candidatus Gracilibacteria bacterium]MDQ7022980.1 transposase [Candidatus Gracilibacteria bacterium]